MRIFVALNHNKPISMKKIFLLALAAVMAASAWAQKPSNDELSTSYNFLSVGYTSETTIGNGAFVQFTSARKLYEGLCFDLGINARYTYWNAWGLADTHSMDARALLGPSYQYNFNEDVAIMAHTGASLGARFALVDEGGTDFVFGWDIGARIKYKRVAFIYTATIGITNMATAHSVGLAFGF